MNSSQEIQCPFIHLDRTYCGSGCSVLLSDLATVTNEVEVVNPNPRRFKFCGTCGGGLSGKVYWQVAIYSRQQFPTLPKFLYCIAEVGVASWAAIDTQFPTVSPSPNYAVTAKFCLEGESVKMYVHHGEKDMVYISTFPDGPMMSLTIGFLVDTRIGGVAIFDVERRTLLYQRRTEVEKVVFPVLNTVAPASQHVIVKLTMSRLQLNEISEDLVQLMRSVRF